MIFGKGSDPSTSRACRLWGEDGLLPLLFFMIPGRGYCRVAVVISDYGTHIEIGSRRGMDSQITWTFREEDLAKARTLLAEYSSI